jgi:Fur family ferric uptake transcriptional regulator
MLWRMHPGISSRLSRCHLDSERWPGTLPIAPAYSSSCMWRIELCLPMDSNTGSREPWSSVPHRLRSRGMRWTAQRSAIVQVLADIEGHVTGAELVQRCRELEPATVASTVYRTLGILEDLGLVRQVHGADGHQGFHVEPKSEHGHRYCAGCGASWEISDAAARAIVRTFRAADGFEVDIRDVTVVGRCRDCQALAVPNGGKRAAGGELPI